MTAHGESFQVQSMFEVGKAKARPWHWRLRVAISARRAFSLRSIFHSNSCCIFFFSCCMLTVVAMLWLADLRGVSPEAGCCRRFSAFLFRFSSSNSACVCISFSLSTAASRLASSTSRCSWIASPVSQSAWFHMRLVDILLGCRHQKDKQGKRCLQEEEKEDRRWMG